MTHLPVSVIVVSRGRPEALKTCLAGLAQQSYQQFEIVVVADPAGLAEIETLPFNDYLKREVFDEPNISKARNLGLAAAAGEIVAFIDDDAVPEPNWLAHLSAPFVDDSVAAAGGYVRGRNGISFQWRAQSVDQTGASVALAVDAKRATILTPTPEQAIKTEGTNMAFRRDVLTEMGGFDPAFAFFYDDTDVNLRLAAAGEATAIVPLAEVHHGYLSSASRRRDRVPRDLVQLGKSYAVFLRKHCASDQLDKIRQKFEAGQKRRLVEHMVAGRLEPEDVHRLMKGLRDGFQQGQDVKLAAPPRIPRASKGFRGFPAGERSGPAFVAGRYWNRRKLLREARKLSETHKSVSVFLFSRTAIYHRVRFEDGLWVQRGGLFGRSDRDQPVFRFWTFRRRLEAERRRVAEQRGLND